MEKGKLSPKNITPDVATIHLSKTDKEASRSKLEMFMKEETRLVKGRFRNFDRPGGPETITVRKYPNIPMFQQEMWDGEVYEIPLYVARFLNGIDVTAEKCGGKIGTCSYGVHGFKTERNSDVLPASGLGRGPDGRGGIPVPIVGVTKTVRRFGFESMEFQESFAQ